MPFIRVWYRSASSNLGTTYTGTWSLPDAFVGLNASGFGRDPAK